MVGASDLLISKNFYDQLFSTIGLKSIYQDDVCVGYAHDGNEDVEFYITKPANGEPVTFGNGTQISFYTETTEKVDNFHKTAIDLGAKNEGEPGFRPLDSNAYYAYIRDPDGNKICSYTSVNV